MNLAWTKARIRELRRRRAADMSYEQVGHEMGCTPAAARAAYKRHVLGRADQDSEAARSRGRRDQLREWEARNASIRNAQRRQRRAAKAG